MPSPEVIIQNTAINHDESTTAHTGGAWVSYTRRHPAGKEFLGYADVVAADARNRSHVTRLRVRPDGSVNAVFGTMSKREGKPRGNFRPRRVGKTPITMEVAAADVARVERVNGNTEPITIVHFKRDFLTRAQVSPQPNPVEK